MAVRTQYEVAENGWVRFEEINPSFKYTASWNTWSGAATSGGTDKRTNTVGQVIRFKFTGTGIRIISPINSDLSSSVRILIDGQEEVFSEYSPTLVWRTCVYEKIGLDNQTHDVQIISNTTALNIFDAVDLLEGNSILPSSIGSILLNPENQWKRIEDIDTKFVYEGNWGSRTNVAYSGGSQKTQANTVLGNKVRFKFYGTKIRVISTLYPSYSPKIRITIDGITDFYTLQGDSTNNALVYEKKNLPLGLHYVEVEKVTNGSYNPDFIWDAIDIDDNGYITDIDFTFNRLVIKSPTTDEYYSLSDSTLIYMPNTSSKNMISYGVKEDNEVQLDIPFNKIKYVIDSPFNNVSGKVFTQDIGKIKTLNIKEVKKDDVGSIYTWYNTNMTSNTTPSPFVASASNIHSSPYEAFKAFNGINSSSSDSWVTPEHVGVGTWVQLFFGKETKIDRLKMSSRNDSFYSQAPLGFKLLYSSNGSQWTEAQLFNTPAWTLPNETRTFVLNKSLIAQYLRIEVTDISDSNVSIGEIQFGYKGEEG